eukprot:7655231-Prorocentrum_lima.AAC.1
MTSSLVGSEMCIRDSVRSPRNSRPPQRRLRSAILRQILCPRTEVRRHCSVSYTHLTLPTICSV